MKRTENGVGFTNIKLPAWLAAVFVLIVIQLPLLAAPPPGGSAPISVPAGGFAIDGDLLANTPAAGVGDWVASPGFPGAGGGVLMADGTVIDPAKTIHIIDPWGNSGSDIIFSGGMKWTDDPNNWTWTGGKPSSKTEINNVLMHIASDTNDQIWMAIAADRASTSGDSYIDFEFLQNTLVRTNNGKFVSFGPHGGRTVNDLLLSLAFTGGGKVADFLAYRWLPDGNGGYAYVDVTPSLPAGGVFVGLNTGTIPVPYGAFGKTTYAANAFAEAVFNMTGLLSGFDPCASIGFKTIMVKTKSSASTTASIEDCIDPVQHTLRIGPVADAGPDQAVCDGGENTAFEVHGIAIGGLRAVKSVLWEVISGSAVIANASSLSTSVSVVSGAATLRFTATQENGCAAVDEVILRVKPLPVADITGPDTVCPASKVTFQAPAGMTSYAWSITGNAAIDGLANARQVAVVSGGQCGETFTLSLNVNSNGCSSTAMANITVNDVLAPKLTVPADRVLACPADGGTNVTGVATAIDECGAVNVTYSDAATNGCGGSRAIARTWTATDHCGNVASAAQMIFIRDLTPPAITVPPDRVLACPASPTTDITGTAVAQDACSRVAITLSDSVSNPCGGSKIVTRTWTATDECGNVASAVQTIAVRDTTPPVLSLPPSLVLECPADASTNATGVASATDDCSAVAITCMESATNTCGSGQVISRNWIATDECGNTASGLQTITVRDTTRPVLNLPADLVLDCPADTGTNATGVATGNDTCGSAKITFSDAVTNICGGSRMVYRTWTAADNCGNAVSATQKITVRDTTRPALILPPNLVLECPADTGTNATGMAFGSDACSAVQIRFSEVVTNGCGGTRTVFRTWTISDECGNVTNGIQTIVVRDTIKPALIVPPDLVFECPADPGTNMAGTATATDGGSTPVIHFNDSAAIICGSSKVITRTWTATDACGNTSSAAQKITVQDTRAPSLALPANVTLECGANTAPVSAGTAVAQDACNSVTIRYSDAVTNICGGSKLILRTWTATDACANATNGVQTITVRDTTPPVLSLPPSLVLECPANTSTNATGVASATDDCSAVAVTCMESVTNTCGSGQVISRNWIATDACGNTASGLQTITVRDTTRPVLKLPADLVLDCPADTGTNATGVATASDTCGSAKITFSDAVTNICGGSRMVYRTWTAADDCGNAVSATQKITVHDTTRPALILPPNLVLEFPAETGTNATGMAIGSDACSAVQIRFTEVVTNGCGGTRTVLRTWTISDECGNVTNGIQTIVVRDTVKPVLIVPPDLVLECPADPGTNMTGTATATDSGSTPVIRFNDSVAVICGNSKVITRTWTATDACGNTSSAAQKITVQDTRAPSLTLPVDITLECGANTAPAGAGTAVAQDACDSATVRYSDAVTNICGGSKLILRTWTATDACGNATNGVQTITVRDTIPPELQLPPNLVIECPGDTRTNVTGVPMVHDGCGSVTLSYSDAVTTNCGITRIVQRLWTAIDQCGHTTNGLQTIIVQDTRKPTIICPAIKVECVGDVPPAYGSLAAFLAAGGTAADTCDSSLAFSLISDSGLAGSCPGKVTRVYRVTDDCGNFAEGTQTIVVDDTIPPALICPPAVTLECTTSVDPADFGGLKATDNCDTNVDITYTDTVIPSQYLVKWYAADPEEAHAPYQPTYLKLSPASLACPDAARLTGRAADPLRNAVAYGPTSSTLDAMTSLGAEPMALGQVVPFEAVIEVSGGSTRPENGTIEFTTSWSTHTTSNDGFGYDTNYMVYCAFVDIADPGLLDPNNNARVESYSSKLVGAGTVDEQIQGTFRVAGLDSGDKVVVEIWVVLMDRSPGHFGGTIASDLVSAQIPLTPPRPISTGNQTVSIGSLSKLGTLPVPQQQPPLPPVPPQPAPLPGYLVSVIDRTWRAVDDCGNQDTCVQRITLRDTTPPTIIVAPSVVLDCTADYGTNVTGGAIVNDACGEATLTFSDVITNTCGSAGSVMRTWTASDGYNITSSVQVITMRDATPPTITCAGNRTVMPTETWKFDEPTAVDTCGTALVSVLSTVTNLADADRMVVTRTWQAADVCGNVATCQQAITVGMPAPLIAPTITTHPECQVAALGGSASLTVEATGSGPMSYQWQFNGVNLPGATTSTLSVENLLFANAGLYTVIVSNAAGTARSPAAVINVAPILQHAYANHELKLTWPAGYTLQSAPTPFGPYVDEPGATSPYVQTNLVDLQKYFRLRADACSLTIAILPSGQAFINVSGAPGMNFIIQASANLIDWVNISTNTAPAQVVDPGSGQGALRFYRAVPCCIEAGMPREQQPPVIVSQSASQTIGFGEDLALSVTVQCAGNCGYQWQRNGISIPGATGSSLSLKDLTFSDAGVYSVLAGNWDGTAEGSPIVVDVAARLLSTMTDGRMILSWPSSFILQSASSPLGPFVDVPGALSPYQPDFSGAPMQFYRLRSVPPTLSTLRQPNGEVSVTLRGSPGINYVIQGTYNFVDWTSLHTGAAPCTYSDSEASETGARFYRAVPASVVLTSP